ncbi:MAG: phosphatidylserine/phosphatidylglycerophosphate/cardiolipin synthase family protein [Sphingomonadales bacterium]|nr:phosphatidylserine/phosphatidylglycerophosphate/cardiolipin synthase family protein [Sphingomonadales bacterium]MBK9002772.1 phosphatidylserine/phosphatidylglycerophosphate/cardiolipin synthase family protein [Sphingomonadales bacterium]MBK9267996.1 phosphatidylserine/phosphatidylglycerophosphate/cardiolipin synthase family protein [Sphingomonadales bacterium]MBP6434190.1 phosphatidylserine/phosphatidylglycerophosphate/cardiolipin synthase family protein [Sphingorhabdus sp.]
MNDADGQLLLPGKRFDISGHRLHILHAPEDRLQALLRLIATAQRSILLSMYMFENDTSGTEVRDALVDAARRGVKVALLVDSFGSSKVPTAFFQPIVDAGGTYHYFSSRWRLSYVIRNHQKVLILDDIHALVGGYNITDQYFGRRGDQSWEDLGATISGPQVARISAYLSELIELSADGGVRLLALRRLIKDWQPGDGPLQWLVGGPTNRLSPWALSLKRDLQNARLIDIVAAYFSPTQSILRRIAKTARSGGAVRLVLAGKTDNGATIGAARILYGYLLKRRVRICEFQPRLLHAKLLVIDDAAYIGSANLDIRSLFINKELMLRIHDADLADYLRDLADGLAQQSEAQTAELHRVRLSWFNRLRWSFAYLLVNSVDYNIGRRISLRITQMMQKRLPGR